MRPRGATVFHFTQVRYTAISILPLAGLVNETSPSDWFAAARLTMHGKHRLVQHWLA